MRKCTRFISVLIVALIGVVGAQGAPKGWEPVRSEHVSTAKSVMKDVEFEVKTTSGAIVVQNNQPVQIKIFTILGRLISSETLQPGSARFTLPAHGVYIVKIGDLTCKVAV